MKQVKEEERLDKVLSNNGFGTRKEVKHLIRSRVVAVDGTVVSDPDAKVNINTASITINGVSIEVKSQIYFMMNKKAGYVCTTKSGLNPIVFDLLKEEDHRKYLGGELGMVGRLDIDTEGLLIITSDGELNHRLTSPKYRIPKTYLVYLRDSVTEENRKSYTEKLAAGVHIAAEGKEEAADCLPAELEWKDEKTLMNREGKTPEAACCITVYEGKFHEVKRLFAALGNEVVYLKREKINGLQLDETLQPGEYRELTEEELKALSPASAENGTDVTDSSEPSAAQVVSSEPEN